MENINLYALRNPEFYQFASDVLAIVSSTNATAMQVADQHQKLKSVFDEMTPLFKLRKGFATTEEVEALDGHRDRTITGLAAIVNGNTYHYDEAMRKHAEKLSENLKLYGNGSIARENYVSETAIISNLVNDWNTKPELAAAVTALSLDGWKTKLDEANKAFNEAFLTRNAEKSAASPEKLKQKRQEAMVAWYELRDHISAHNLLKKGAEPYGKTVKDLEALVAQYAQLIKNRKGRNGSAEEETPNPPDDEPPVE